MSSKPLKENSFDGAPGGAGGAIVYAPGWGTHSSPNVTQTPNAFGSFNTKPPAKGMMADSGSAELSQDIDKLMAKKDPPTIDDIVTGINWELNQMITRDKKVAKQRVVANLKKNPHYYSDLDQLNINMDKTPEEIEKEKQMTERKKIFEDMVSQRTNVRDLDPRVTSVMKDMWEEKQRRRNWSAD
jgi:hypothetical protein